MFRLQLVCLSIFGLLCVSCTRSHCPTSRTSHPAEILATSAEPKLNALKLEARVEQWGREGRVKGSVFMFVERPGRVRMDVMTQLGPVATFTSQDGYFALYDKRESVFYVGESCPSNLGRLVGVRLRPEQVIEMLLGEAKDCVKNEAGWTVHYAKRKAYSHPDGGEVRLPEVIRFIDHTHKSETTIKLRSVVLEPEIPAQAFSQSTPNTVRTEQVLCQE